MNASQLELEGVLKLTRDQRKAAETMGLEEVRFLVDQYYQIQDFRKAGENMTKASADSDEPFLFTAWLAGQLNVLETSVRSMLDRYSGATVLGKAVREVIGIGPVLAAGLLAHIDITKAPTVGHIWRFAGLDPTSSWGEGQKRPWNAKLKVLCWKIGESFVKVSGHPEDLYGKVYAARKEQEHGRNVRGELADQAASALKNKRFRKETDAYAWYSGCLIPAIFEGWEELNSAERTARVKGRRGVPGSGLAMLPPAHIHARAKRYAVKLFLSDYHRAGYLLEYKQEPPKPYVLEHCPGHAHIWTAPWVDDLKGVA